MSGITPGPLPSTKVFIHEIPNLPAGSKIRFLGCVNAYNVASGKLTLAHHYPQERHQAAQISVDITTTLESIKNDDLQIGSWLNIIGYVQQLSNKATKKDIAEVDLTSEVQAIMLWNAGAIQIRLYEQALAADKDGPTIGAAAL